MSSLETNSISKYSGNNVSLGDPLNLKSYDTSGRDALTSSAGDVIYNTTDSKVQVYNGSAWQDLGGVEAIQVEFSMIAGGGSGGGGGAKGAGGGGAGGYRSNFSSDNTGGGVSTEANLFLALNSNYTISIGAGGTGVNTNYTGGSGTDSTFATITCNGGGAAGVRSGGAVAGGCGGGGGGGTADVNGRGGSAAGTPGQGFEGGGGNLSNLRMGGGGGTAGKGFYADTDAGENGGEGTVSTLLTTTQATTYSVGEVSGSSVYFGGGGGSSRAYYDPSQGASSVDGTGGVGGGGNGYGPSNAESGTANTGGGGGGTANGTGGNGGSGVVIIRFADTYSITGLTGLTYSNFTSGGYKYYIFTQGASSTVQFS